MIQAAEDANKPAVQISFFAANSLIDEEMKDLTKFDPPLSSWAWDSYSTFYGHYCRLAQQFRCSKTYSAKSMIGELGTDWYPLGFSRRTPVSGDPCAPEVSKEACEITDWRKAAAKLLPVFGARVFLLENLNPTSIAGRYMIDFVDPEHQKIPDLEIEESTN